MTPMSDGNVGQREFLKAVKVPKHLEFLVDGFLPLEPVVLLPRHVEGRVEACADDAFGGQGASFEKGCFAGGDAAGAGYEGLVAVNRTVEVGRGGDGKLARVVDHLVVFGLRWSEEARG